MPLQNIRPQVFPSPENQAAEHGLSRTAETFSLRCR